MKLQYFTEVCQKILTAVVAGIEVIFMLDGLSPQLPIEFLGSSIKSEFILTAAVEIDGHSRRPYQCPVPLRKDKRTVFVPVMDVNGIAECCPERPTLGLLRRFHDERGTLCADGRE